MTSTSIFKKLGWKNRQREKIKIWIKVNKVETEKKAQRRINKIKTWIFEKVNLFNNINLHLSGKNKADYQTMRMMGLWQNL